MTCHNIVGNDNVVDDIVEVAAAQMHNNMGLLWGSITCSRGVWLYLIVVIFVCSIDK